MKPISALRVLSISLLLLTAANAAEEEPRIAELNAYWATVSRAVKEGDFAAYAATCHPEAVLVTGTKKASYPLSKALARWKQEFVDTAEGKRSSNVEFRFSQRLGDETTAHETGIFLYSFKVPGEELKKEYVQLQALLVKKDDGWKILMEYQIAPTTEAAWKALQPNGA